MIAQRNNVILKTIGLKKYYGETSNIVKALDGIDLSIFEGEFVSIVGTSGSGKTTLLHMLGALDTPSEGIIEISGSKLSNMNDQDKAIFRRRNIGFVFQNYNLVPVLNVYENITLPVELDNKEVDKSFVLKIVEMLGLSKKLKNLPNNLFGGQQQRVAIARALVAKPAVILADEPTGNLDSKTSDDVMALLKASSENFNQTVVMITHNKEIAKLADRTIHIEDGRIIK